MDQRADMLEIPIEFLKGVGPARAELLKKELGIFTFGHLLNYYPYRYIDRSSFYLVKDILNDSTYIQLKGMIYSIQLAGQGRTQRLTARFTDSSGSLDLIWFKGIRWVKPKLISGSEYVIFGKPGIFNNRFNMPHPEFELLAEFKEADTGFLQPMYSSTEKLRSRGLDNKGFGKIVKNLLIKLENYYFPETLSVELIQSLKLPSRKSALFNIHFPTNQYLLNRAQALLKFEELFFIQLNLLKLKLLRTEKLNGLRFEKVGTFFNAFFQEYLPFELTGAQKKVIREIRQDMGSGKQMNRLLQGDVGSGKTLVALMNILIALDNGYQASLMAPTEILAQQHYKTIFKMLDGMDIQIALLTGSTKSKQRKPLHELLQSGDIHILIGTHALIEDTVQFKNLGLVVIDEQHRFGVAQRAKLWTKNTTPPHILVMTATPIPRTLAMTFYGDLDVSVIDELPPGRKPIKTFHFYDKDRLKLFGFMRRQIDEGRQIYIVYPLINESEKLDLKDLMDGFESISRAFPLPKYAISIVHGQLKSAEKNYEMQRFVKGETQIMVSTTVIEVGVDVPNASVMVIENAERFGLSQLHQLRGRVGRGADQSYCILMSKVELTTDGRKRLQTMVKTNDGFEIAEVDLKLRGPGDLHGTQQSGILELKIADIIKDEKILKYARETAIKLLEDDPHLEKGKNLPIANHLNQIQRSKTNWSLIS